MKSAYRILRFYLVKFFIQGTLIFFTPVFALAQMATPPNKTLYSIDENSKLTISGTSNVTNFVCCCEENFKTYHYNLLDSDNKAKALFRETIINLRTESFDCGNRGITRDMWKALKSNEYPEIKIELLQVLQGPHHNFNNIKNSWFEAVAIVKITIANNSKIVNLKVDALKSENNKIQFISSCNLLMSEFGIQPPVHLFELIKVSDKITIDFDLCITIL